MTKGQIIPDGLLVHSRFYYSRGQNGFDFGGKEKRHSIPKVVKRFNANSITQQKESFSLAIPSGHREHSIPSVNCVHSFSGQARRNNFGVAERMKGLAASQ